MRENSVVHQQEITFLADPVPLALAAGSCEPPDGPSGPDDLSSYIRLLTYVVRRKFGIPEAEVPEILNQVFLKYLQKYVGPGAARFWLIAATCNASRHYLRCQQAKALAAPEMPRVSLLSRIRRFLRNKL